MGRRRLKTLATQAAIQYNERARWTVTVQALAKPTGWHLHRHDGRVDGHLAMALNRESAVQVARRTGIARGQHHTRHYAAEHLCCKS